MRGVLAVTVGAMTLCGTASAQVASTLDWSRLGLNDEAAIASGTFVEPAVGEADVNTTVTWRVDDVGTAGNFAVATGRGADYLSYETQTQGGVAGGYAELAFDASSTTDADRLVMFVSFDRTVTNVAFTLTDID